MMPAASRTTEAGRHSLVTPIDWKRPLLGVGEPFDMVSPFFGDAY